MCFSSRTARIGPASRISWAYIGCWRIQMRKPSRCMFQRQRSESWRLRMLPANTTKPSHRAIQNIISHSSDQRAASFGSLVQAMASASVAMRLRIHHNRQIRNNRSCINRLWRAMWSLAFPVLVGGWLRKNGLSATGFLALNSKYRLWYDGLIDRAKAREIPQCYTEIHHIVPRSLGGTDTSENLVRLTYREHFIAHWLLTKFHSGLALRKMQRALLAMSLDRVGQRLVSGWQIELAKRTVRDLELDPVADQIWYDRWRSARASYVPGWKKPRDRKSKRPSKRVRLNRSANSVFAPTPQI